jgi:hypothetical protein
MEQGTSWQRARSTAVELAEWAATQFAHTPMGCVELIMRISWNANSSVIVASADPDMDSRALLSVLTAAPDPSRMPSSKALPSDLSAISPCSSGVCQSLPVGLTEEIAPCAMLLV